MQFLNRICGCDARMKHYAAIKRSDLLNNFHYCHVNFELTNKKSQMLSEFKY